MAAEILKIRSLGAFSFFSEFEAAFILLLTLRLLFSSVFLCVSLLWPWQSDFMTHLLKGRSLPPCYIWKVFMGVLAGQFTSAAPASHILPGSGVCLLCPCQFGGCHFSSFFSIHGLWLRDQLNGFMFFSVVWSILVKQYFWQNMFHWVLNGFSKMSMTQASHLGMNT